uniref:Uncharacterized protein n=1 Tax=uncultured bacterium A1Q1_fos_75 TaxID=1256589 RepID=L7VW21_9BACT|nr:hypothetical protein [uncultured bacterium A1Q1_fos_75]
MAEAMSDLTDTVQVQPEFRLDASREGYIAALTEASSAAPVVAIRMPRSIVDRTVLEAAGLTLELRADGSVAVYADAIDLGTLVSVPLVRLVAEALAQIEPEEAVQELASLVTALEQALALAQQERDRQIPHT